MELSTEAKNLWGKKKIDKVTGEEKWLPLIVHLLDTQNTIEYLYNNWLNESQRKILKANNDDKEILKLVKFVGGIHDIGKATPAFQLKRSYENSVDLDNDIVEKLERSGFDQISKTLFDDIKATPHNIAGAKILRMKKTTGVLNKSIASIINAHHGWFESNIRKGKIENYVNNYFQDESNEIIQEKWKNIQNELIAYILKRSGYESLEEIPQINETQSVILTGLLIMADWLASGEYLGNSNTPMFPLVSLNKGFEDIDIQKRYQHAMELWGKEDNWEPQGELEVSEYYQNYWDYSPREVQEKTTNFIQNLKESKFIIIESGTGSGKTELALTLAEILSARKGIDGVFFALPTQATSNAMFSRVTDWLNTITAREDIKVNETLLHGKAKFNKEYNHLPILSELDDTENINEKSGVGTDSWFTGKKSILAKFNVGTIDHILSMGLAQRHIFLKHLGLSGKVVILDEIHAYDAYMNSYLQRVLGWFAAYNIPVIALSATLPKQSREQLIKAYYQFSTEDGGVKYLALDSEWKNNISYPLVTVIDGENVVQLDNFAPTTETEITIKRLNQESQGVVNEAIKKIVNGGIAGIVVNTVKRAQEICSLIPKDIPTIILHSAFIATDREKIEEELQKAIGKNGIRPEKLVVIGTQVLEQSLDIDFDVLFTDIAPMDLLLQRIGRLHRHQRRRPAGLETPITYIMDLGKIGSYGDANESIYSKYILTKTDYFLPKKIISPSDISQLVQKVYEEGNDNNLLSVVPNINTLKHEFNVEREKQEENANKFQIDKPNLSNNTKVPLKKLLPSKSHLLENNEEIKVQATVRDIKETIEVVLLKRNGEGGLTLVSGKEINLIPSKNIAQQVIRLPQSVSYNLDKLIASLEENTRCSVPNWQDDPWLKGSLVLILDKNNEVKLEGYTLSYSTKLGLSINK